MAKSQEGSPTVGFITLIISGFLLYSCFSGDRETPEERAAKVAEEAEDKRRGFHCLSGWDGSHAEFKRRVKSMMRDPDSFEHVETRVAPISSDGTHNLLMKYRAQNGFGGMTLGTALGTYQNNDCSFTVLSVE